jgi:hypothetical protein
MDIDLPLGYPKNRKNEIGNEWELHTREKVKQSDPHILKLLTDKQYAFPNVLSNGAYRK